MLEPAHVNVVIIDNDIDGPLQGGADLGDGLGEVAFVTSMGNKLTSLDEALSGAHVTEWQTAWDKEMSQLEAACT